MCKRALAFEGGRNQQKSFSAIFIVSDASNNDSGSIDAILNEEQKKMQELISANNNIDKSFQSVKKQSPHIQKKQIKVMKEKKSFNVKLDSKLSRQESIIL